MTRRRLEVLDGGGGGGRRDGTRDDAGARVLCIECRFHEVRYFICPDGNYHPFDSCMVNSQQKCAIHNPEGLCPKFECAASASVADTRRLVFRLRILAGLTLVIVLTMVAWGIFG